MPATPFARILLMLLAMPLVACVSPPRAVPVVDQAWSHTVYYIYVGWHTSILIEADTLLAHSPQLARDFQGQKYIRVGWGDGDYFTGKSRHWTTATKALLASDYSALQVLGYPYDPLANIPLETRVPLLLSDEGMVKLAHFIERSIARSVDGEPSYLPPSKLNDNLFYLATDSYHIFNNCNTWSSRALREAGLPFEDKLTVTANGAFKQAWRISASQRR